MKGWHVNGELERMWKEEVEAYLRCYPGIRVEGLTKAMKNLSQYSRSLGRDLNPGPSKHKAGVLTTRSPRSAVWNIVSQWLLDTLEHAWVMTLNSSYTYMNKIQYKYYKIIIFPSCRIIKRVSVVLFLVTLRFVCKLFLISNFRSLRLYV
jgi:hypothetical protein